ncbi:MAG: putative molybdenum cofactor guanylyltransferase [Syntrophaceae bacterium PtaB.Bin038]|nr:MAG: putative molybdenum cofactor guanylyltransferase [Syntrophaceae bacterium PtaB.Bin038]
MTGETLLEDDRRFMTGIILAGGRAGRMGGINKAFIEVGGERLIDRTMRLYRALFREIIISTNSPLEYLEFDARIVTDLYPGKGPLGGIHAGLLHATCEQAFVSACDMPYLSEAFIGHLIAQAEGYDLVVPVTAGGYESLHAVYSRRCLPVIESQIERGELKVALLFRKFRTREIPAGEILRFDPEGRIFANLNRPEDLQSNPRPGTRR